MYCNVTHYNTKEERESFDSLSVEVRLSGHRSPHSGRPCGYSGRLGGHPCSGGGLVPHPSMSCPPSCSMLGRRRLLGEASSTWFRFRCWWTPCPAWERSCWSWWSGDLLALLCLLLAYGSFCLLLADFDDSHWGITIEIYIKDWKLIVVNIKSFADWIA